MKYGVSVFLTDDGISIDELALLAEDRGFESLFLPEHSHIPAGPETEHPAGGEVPEEYWRTLDPFVALAVAAQVTTRLRLGTGICLVPQRDPIQLAKEVASVDFLSEGRFLFGIGAGWNQEEMANHGTDPSRRFALMRERVLAMKEIWTSEEASYEGELVSFERIRALPKPVQHPHPPILVGGRGPRVLERVIDYGDEWLPVAIPGVLERIAELRERGRELDREIPVTMYMADQGDVEAYERAGVHRSVFFLPPRDAAATRAALDRLALELGL